MSPPPPHHLPDSFDNPGSDESSLMLGATCRRAGGDSRWSRACSSTTSPPPFTSSFSQDPDIKGRWSETMKLQVRCQLPFETKHSPNPGKTQPVPGIRTNKVEPREEWWGRGGKSGEEKIFTVHVDDMASAEKTPNQF